MTCRLGVRAACWGPVVLAALCQSLAGQAPAGATEPAAVRPVTVTAGAQYRALRHLLAQLHRRLEEGVADWRKLALPVEV